MALDKKYNAQEVEKKWQQFWDKEKIYCFNWNSSKPTYSIDTPPPTVSGSLTMGHISSYIHTEIQARFFRMRGFNVFYPMGYDDNGLPSERLTEKTLNIKAQNLSRDEFIKKCYTSCKQYEKEYEMLWKRMGLSIDWSTVYTTIEERSRRISQRSFLELLKTKKIYHKEEPVMWCPTCATAIAQAEMAEKNFKSTFNDLVFVLDDGNPLIIATTRPELLPSCVAVFVHPEDKRYRHIVNRKAKVPVFGQTVPILSDVAVDKEKGTGVVMCCTFGDRQDIEWWKRHNLPLKISITEDGKMNEIAGEFQGLSIEDARRAIINKAHASGLVKTTKAIEHEVNTHERCETPIEFLSKPQWFLRVMDIKDKLIARADEIQWYPAFMKNRYLDWVRNLAWDWCLSRQRFYGVPIPVWHCRACGNFILPEENDLPVDPLVDAPPENTCRKCGSTHIEPETDVLDTWATSSLTPEINFRWKEFDERKQLYPMSLRPQSHDIIRTWTFYTIVKSHLHHNSVPWKNVVISGFVTVLRDEERKVNIKGGKKTFKAEKISKSKHGDLASPFKLLDRFNADILRYWASSGLLGTDMLLKLDDIEIGKRVQTKIWNAFRFISLHLEKYEIQKPKKLEAIDAYLLSRHNHVIKHATDYFEQYEFRLARNVIVDFFWKDFCDNYLEIIKDRLYNPDKRGVQAKNSALFTTCTMGRTLLGLFAPYLPFIAEELYQRLYRKYENVLSIHVTQWPEPLKFTMDDTITMAGNMFFTFLAATREMKGNRGISQKEEIKKAIIYATDTEHRAFKSIETDFLATTHLCEYTKQQNENSGQYRIEFPALVHDQ
jgi:valyl-tRNA synthetase